MGNGIVKYLRKDRYNDFLERIFINKKVELMGIERMDCFLIRKNFLLDVISVNVFIYVARSIIGGYIF